MRNAIAVLLLLVSAEWTLGGIVFQDGFESGPLDSHWTLSGTKDGRSIITSDFAPATGQGHLVMDDAVNDAVSSIAETTLTLDLSHKRNVVLSFKAKSLGNEADAPPPGNFTGTRAYDGVAVSIDGGTTWRVVQSLGAVDTAWQSFSITLDSAVTALGGNFAAGFRIRFSEFDNAPAPLDGIALDDVVVTADDVQRVVVEVPSPLIEGTGSQTGYVVLAYAQGTPLTLTLTATPAQLSLPSTITIPAGATYASFDFSVNDNGVVDLTRTVSVNATADDVISTLGVVTVYDDEAPIPALSLPAQLTEGASPLNNATLSINHVASVPLTVSLSAVPAGELSMPATVTIPAGQTQTVFTIQATNDTRIDGNLAVTVSATAPGIQIGTAQTMTIDNESRAVLIDFPATIQEGSTATGIVLISGTLPSPLTVNLTSGDPMQLTVPTTVTIPSGSTTVAFALTAADNSLLDGSRSVLVTAGANGLDSSSRPLTVRDNEIGGYRFGPLTDIVNVSSPISIAVMASDIEGNPISGASATVSLKLVLPDGSTQSVAPGEVTIGGLTGWTGIITLPAASSPPLRLRATDANRNTGDSTAFDIMRVVPLNAAELVWDASRGRLYASVPTTPGGLYSDQVVAIDPVGAQITGSASITQNPGPLALTSGGETLYVGMTANGRIAKVDPASMTVSSTFPVGTDPSYGTLYATDICTVVGQPNLVVVSQTRPNTSPNHQAVAVYDNGVSRPNKPQASTGYNRIEPSGDPNIFFALDYSSAGHGFRQLKLDANGLTLLAAKNGLVSAYPIDMQSEGNNVFFTTGTEIDGANLRVLGNFPITGTGPVRSDLASHRIYFVEPQSSSASLYDKIGAFDPTTFSLIRRSTLPPVTAPASLLRWGTNGLAFRSGSSVVLINSSQLIPTDPSADLTVTVEATPDPAAVGGVVTYNVQLRNPGPNTAHNAILTTSLSNYQTIQSTTASVGLPSVSGMTISLPVGDLAVDASVSLVVTTTPQSAGPLSCNTYVNSSSIDPNFANNAAFKALSVGFQVTADSVNQLRLAANNLIYDSGRRVLWASLPNTVEAPLGKSIVAIDPTTGRISDSIPLNGNPMMQSMVLSGNGRYLYVGLSDIAEVQRIDLSATPYTSFRIPLGLNQWSSAGYAEDIEPLDGDGTSFLVTTTGDDAASVYDGSVRRPTRTGIYTVDRIEKTATPGVFLGYCNSSTSYYLSRLSVTASGVSVTQAVQNVVYGGREILGYGNLALSNTGLLVDAATLSLRLNFGTSGRPCLDGQNGRAYILTGGALRGFDTATGLATSTLSIPGAPTGDWALSCVRWGLDGFAILGNDGKIYIARWSSTIPSDVDRNGDLLSDAWETTYFGTLNVSTSADPDGDGIPNALEYFMGTSPIANNPRPIQSTVTRTSGQAILHLLYPRRIGVDSAGIGYEVTADLQQWNPAVGVTETVLSSQTVGGVQTQTIDAAIPAPTLNGGFARLKWLGP